MNRRQLITLVGGAVAAWPLVARGQPKLLTIGFLGANASAWSPYIAAFEQRLNELGWRATTSLEQGIKLAYRAAESYLHASEKQSLTAHLTPGDTP